MIFIARGWGHKLWPIIQTCHIFHLHKLTWLIMIDALIQLHQGINMSLINYGPYLSMMFHYMFLSSYIYVQTWITWMSHLSEDLICCLTLWNLWSFSFKMYSDFCMVVHYNFLIIILMSSLWGMKVWNETNLTSFLIFFKNLLFNSTTHT